jgi:creatinine amidohydrolase
VQRDLQRLTWKDIKRLVPGEIDTIILPVGTVEAHGAAALGTDNIIPESISAYIAGKINALIAPTVNYGITKSLYGYPGSITVNPDNFKNYIDDILKSFHDIGFKKVIIINGHGGNNSSLKEAAHGFFKTHKVKTAVIHWWEICEDITVEVYGEHGGHAGLNENAMVQAVDESLVDKTLYNKDMAYHFRRGADVYPVPGSILLYKENEGYPDFNADKARQFQRMVFEKIEEFIKLILDRWDQI